jgi:Tol biopolymer transport system component/DNA-binding winged helix-turn-helix (wHTH) protein
MKEHKYCVFSFDNVEVREREFCIVKSGEVLPVEPKAFRVLLFLLRNPHRLITKEELLDAVWNDSAVTENSLSRNIAVLRRLLGDEIREPRYIATVPTVGYRFLCDVEVAEDGLGGLGTTNPGHPVTDSGFEPVEGMDDIQGTPPNLQTAGAEEEVEEEVGQKSDEERRQPRRLLLPGLIAAAIVIFVTGLLVHRAVSNRNTPRHAVHPANAAPASSGMRIVPLTSLSGAVWDPAFSPDGEKVAFIWDGENPGRGDLYVQLVGGEKPLRLTHTGSGFTRFPDWSPDGRAIAFGRCDDKGGGVFVVPALGGSERKLTDVICPFGDGGYPKWIADGRSLVLADRCTPDGPRGIVLFSLTTGEKRCIHTLAPGDSGDMAPVVSPDQKTVAFLSSSAVGVPEIYTAALSGGNLRQITPDGTEAWGPMWSSDGQYITFNSARSGLSRVWRVPAAGGVIEPETVYPGTGALSRDGRRLAYVEPPGFFQGSVVISRMVLSSAGGQVVSQDRILASDGGIYSLQPSPDGRQIIFQSARSGREEIWRSDGDGSNPLQMTFFDKGYAGAPRWSPDGKWIAFDYDPEMHRQIYLIDSEGRNLHMVTSGNYENVVPGWSRDGRAVYFASSRTGSYQVWRRELATGLETQVTHHGGIAVFESYDAKTLYYSKSESGGIWSVPVGGGEEHQVTDALHRWYWGDFSVTDMGIYLLDSDAVPKPTIMFYNFQTRLLTPVHQLEETPVRYGANLGASRDGRTVLFAQGDWHCSITMAENFQ